MQIVNKRIDEIHPYAKNPRKNDAAVEPVANSIKEFGFKVPIVIDKDGEIVAGHTRYKAAIRLGMEEVPCIVADDLTPKQIKAFRLADNKVSEAAEWDISMLNLELDELDMDMEQFGFVEALDKTDLKDLDVLSRGKIELCVTCESESDVQALYDEMVERGYECRISTL